MCKLFSEFSKTFSFAKERKAEIERNAEVEIDEINKDTNTFLELNKNHSEKNKKKIEKLSEKMKVAIDENDLTLLDSQINDMMALLDEDSEAKIKQEILDRKLQDAKIVE